MFIRILCLSLDYPKQGCWCLRLNKGNRSSSGVNQLDIETEECVTKGPQQVDSSESTFLGDWMTIGSVNGTKPHQRLYRAEHQGTSISFLEVQNCIWYSL